MIRRLIHALWLFPLGLALAMVAPGCSEPNESEFKEGGGNQQGRADPKYARDTPETYKQYYEDSRKKAVPAKALKSAPTKPAPDAAAPPPPEKTE
jgi:hypothetical protein